MNTEILPSSTPELPPEQDTEPTVRHEDVYPPPQPGEPAPKREDIDEGDLGYN